MPFEKTDTRDALGLLERVYFALQGMLEEDLHVDVVQFAEDKGYFGQKLYPRQRLILKLYYKLELTTYPCWCWERNKYYADPGCPLCQGEGIYDELKDVKRLLSCKNKYGRLHFPGLCRHHILGECNREVCHTPEALPDYRVLSDGEIRERLRTHHAHILEVIAGRRGSKSVLGALVNGYETYKLLRDPNPQARWKLIPGQPMGTANVATDETQALVLFNQLKALMEHSPWFKRQGYRSLESLIDFTGRALFARSLHSNSASVRGQTLAAVFLDEFCHFNRTGGKLSDKAMWAALAPSVITFKEEARIVITSSPLNKAGVAWDWFDMAERGKTPHVIAFQLATWEMNPTISRDDPEIASAYILDPEYAEMEYGAQWAESVGQFIPIEAIEACVNRDRGPYMQGEPGTKYQLHLDLSKKRDRTGLVIVHWDKERRKVVLDLAEEFDPKELEGEMLNELGEIDVEKIFEHIVKKRKQYGFRFNSVTYDQFNSQWLGQALRREFGDYAGEWIAELHVTDKLNREAFGNLRSIIVQGGLEIYRHPELISQLSLLSKTVKESGAWKVEAPPGLNDDLADALAFAVLRCLELSLGISSGIVLVERPAEEGKRKGEEMEGHPLYPKLKHHKECRPDSCTWECPIVQALAKPPR